MNARRQKLLAVSALVIFSAFALLDHAVYYNTAPPRFAQSRDRDYSKYHRKTFRVVNVVDGDTIDINQPDNGYLHTRIRLLGVDTPETKNPNQPIMHYGIEAFLATQEWTLEQKVTILLDELSPTRDKYGRLLCHVQLPDKTLLNERLVSDGYAYADLRFEHSFYRTYRQLGNKAMKKNAGLWQNVTPDQLPEWLTIIKPKLLTSN